MNNLSNIQMDAENLCEALEAVATIYNRTGEGEDSRTREQKLIHAVLWDLAVKADAVNHQLCEYMAIAEEKTKSEE